MRLAIAIALVAVLAGCGGKNWDEDWRDAGGKLVPEHVVTTFEASCVEGAVFLTVAWPLGTRLDDPADMRWYVRDPEGTLASWGNETLGSLDTNATLPEGARNTGYRMSDLQLWFGNDARKAAYLVEENTVERWPRLTEAVGCQ